MACIKGVSRSASVALAPDAPYMAAGTMAGAVDLSFSSSANLDIFKVDFQSDDRELTLVGECPSSERFNRLAWGRNGSTSEEFSLGLIAGGLVDGNIDIWNPLSLIRSQSGESVLVGHLSVHKGPVRGLEFNGLTPNLLASGADDGEICIWDLAKPSEPSHFPVLKGGGSAAQGEISFLSWNRKGQQILASTSYNGTTVVWDLRKQKPVISFADSVRRRCSVLQWNPDIATQIIVASDDDTSPTLKLWDMRNTMSPMTEFVGHTRGVIAMEWCPSDSSYLLTCAKDNRTICWDTNTTEIVAELPAGNNWNFDVHWYPKIPGVISASSFDGKIGIYNIEGCNRYGAGENYLGAASLRAPKWYKRPVGASFGFGGKLVSFHQKPPAKGVVFLHSLIMEQSLVGRSSEFEEALEKGDKSSLRVLCEKKSQVSESSEEKETWDLLKIMFEDEGTTRTKLICHLGFSLPSEEKETVDGLSSDLNGIRLEDTVEKDAVEPEDNKEAAVFSMDNGEDFFNNLPSPKADTPVSTSAGDFTPPVTDSAVNVEEIQQMPEEEEESSDPVFGDAVQRALVVGDYKGAVAQCISANKFADALVIAHVGGVALWESTRDRYLKMNSAPYMKVVSAMVNNDLMTLVRTRPPKFWKETLALLCTFAQGDEWTSLCDALASKLLDAGNTVAATLCYICAGNVDKTVEIWSSSLANERDGKSYSELLQDLMEKTLVLALATGNKRFSTSLCRLFESYAEILASQGLLTTAMKCLKVLESGGLSPELSILRDRIALSAEPVSNVAAAETQTAPVVNSQPQNLLPYHQEAPQMKPSVPGSPYDNQHQTQYNDSYTGGYVPSSSHPPMQQQSMFMPHQPQPVLQPSFAPAPVSNAQPSMRTTFVPSTPPALKNVEQYQQPTMGSHMFTGSFNPAYPTPPGPAPHGSAASQVSHFPTPKMPQVVAPTKTPIGFTPMATPGVAPRSGMGSVQPASPPAAQQAAAQPAPTPATPPPTVQTADTSNVPAHQKPIIATLTRLFSETSEALGGARANPAKKREIEDNSRKLGALFVKLNSGDISKNAADKLVQLCQALDNHDFSAALQIQVLLTTSEWDECNFWLATLKRMIKTRQHSVR
ncbi:PREDICTED: protein transport protein SEC31 homolog B-like isoform X2 [Tarenaya hassleriana]|uniref:protein transport protein SEC31 homolog B-like isoform X2 n=1 Tax=Tarenaya hassleriana TaxID=28532 RepID=UPI00053C1D2E|nr:PREDICTED: protein transport protein SEC31 homolog B-like isoform X2 [Tarenaya hassleriana]